ncbi:cytoplasmic protein YaiE [Klebsiella pneumoniae subsp. rhinoscleromatis]|nr:cytoplasmic protein YaiE [Klebsiella pneumoniae subsp. rhinoscleromatis]
MKSIGFTSSSTGRASVGVMAEGEYTFGTAQPEEMTVVSGALNVLLPGETEWKVYAAGEVFNVPGNSEFHLQVAEPTSYLVPLSVSQRDARRLPPGCFFLPARQEGKRRLALRFAAESFHQALDQGSQLAGH